MKKLNNNIFKLTILSIFSIVLYSSSFAAKYSIDILEITINGKLVNKFDNLVLEQKDTITFYYALNQGENIHISPFLYKCLK